MTKMFIGDLLSNTIEKRSFSVFAHMREIEGINLAHLARLSDLTKKSRITHSDSECELLLLIHIPSSYTLYLPINDITNLKTAFGVA